jgi:acyl dehydratase
MPIDPNAIGAKTKPNIFEWTDRDTLLYALGVGAGTQDLAFTTENSHDIPQQVLPTYAVIACLPFAAAGKIGTFNFATLLHGSQEIRLHKPLPPAGKLSVVAEVADIQDKGEGKNAIVMLKATGTDPDTSDVIAETLTTAVIRGEGGFGGQPGQRPVAPEIPNREPDAGVALPTREDQALIYRLSGDRNPLHSDPWFAQNLAGFPRPILHGPRSAKSAPGSLRRCSRARRSSRRYGAPGPGTPCSVPRRPTRTDPTPGWFSKTAPPNTSTERPHRSSPNWPNRPPQLDRM